MISLITSPQVHDIPSSAGHFSLVSGIILGAVFTFALLMALLSGTKGVIVFLLSVMVIALGSYGGKILADAYATAVTGKPLDKPDQSLSFAQTIENDYDVTVYDFSPNWINDGWNFTALTEDKRYDCDVLPLEDDTKYSVYCDQNGVTVSLDTLVK